MAPYPVALVVPLTLLFIVVSNAFIDFGDVSPGGMLCGIANVPTSLRGFLSVEACWLPCDRVV